MNPKARSNIMSNGDGSLSKRDGRKKGRITTEPESSRMSDERIEHERTVWVQQRQAELEGVFDTHDTLVREAFHLEKFVTLLSYDPKVAKSDTSTVFQEYHARFDLVNNASTAGPSRQTRRAHTERLHILKGSSDNLSVASPKAKRGKKADSQVDISTSSMSISAITTSQSIPSTLRKKAGPQPETVNGPLIVSPEAKGFRVLAGRGKRVTGLPMTVPSNAADKGKHIAFSDVAPSLGMNRKGKGRLQQEEVVHVPSTLNISRKGKTKIQREDVTSDTHSPLRRQKKRMGEDIAVSCAHPPPPPKKRRVAAVSSDLSSGTFPPSQAQPSNSISAVLTGRTPARKRMSLNLDGFATPRAHGLTTDLSPHKSALKRIKLIVRAPEPVYTNPRQKPPPPRHGQSLTSLLSSYTILSDQDVDEAGIKQLVKKDAALWDRVDTLRRQGRFFPGRIYAGEDMLLVSGNHDASAGQPSRDVWAHVVDAVKARAQHRSINGRQVAAQVASRVRAYWDTRALKEDKVKLQEEKRLRALAKATVRMVVAEWKKAVHASIALAIMHIREEERLKREEEERRRGHEHLDAILDQSGQILEAQQLDLSKAAPRARSRSSDIPATLKHSAPVSSDPDEDDDDDLSGQDDDGSAIYSQHARSSSESQDDDAGVDSSFLLGNVVAQSPRRWSRSRSLTDVSNHSSSVSHFQDAADNLDMENDVSQADIDQLEYPSSPSTYSEQQSFMKLYSPTVASRNPSENAMQDIIADTSGLMPTSRSSINLDPIRNSSSAYRLMSSGTPEEMLTDNFLELEYPESPRLSLAVSEAVSEREYEPQRAIAAEPITSVLFPSVVEENTSSAEVKDSLDEDQYDQVSGPQGDLQEDDVEENVSIPPYLRPYAVAPVEWDPQSAMQPPFLLRGSLRPYQNAGLEWLASLHANNLNGILADEMGLGKTIQTIALLAHLACDRGIWGPHLIIVPTSVLLNWEMEFKKFLPGFKVLSYHGTTKRRKELRQGWNNKYHFNVCVTSYTLASRDAHVFKRKPWYYMILDEAHMIKNFKSQRWNILLMFRSFRRLLLTGTPLQNNLTELWALLQFLMSGTNFANLKEFGEWFSNPLEKAIEMGTMDDETQQRVTKLHTVLRPYLLRRLKRDVEKELPQKYEHLVMCALSKRQRFLYDEFMARAETRHDLQSGVYQKIANILMQLRKVVNHPDLFEVRPIVTSFAMDRSAIADYEIKELLIRRRLLHSSDEDSLDLDVLGLQFVHWQNTSRIAASEIIRLDGTAHLPMITELPGEPPPYDTRSVEGYKRYRQWQLRAARIARWAQIGYLNRLRCARFPVYSRETIAVAQRLYVPLIPLANLSLQSWNTVTRVHSAIKSYSSRAEDIADLVDRFAFVTPNVVARDMPEIALAGVPAAILQLLSETGSDVLLHRVSVKLQIAFPDPSLLQFDCGKLQELSRLLRERKAGGHRILIFTQMTRILDILEIFLNFHGYLYLRLDGATKIEDRQYITERFNSDPRVFCFISSSRSGGVGINLTGADTVIFYDSDFNPQMDRQCEDRAHRIGQIRDVHIYRFISRHTVEEALLRKANQKRSLDDIVIQKGEFDWRSLFSDESALTKALGEYEDAEDAHAAAVAASEEVAMVGADEADFSLEGSGGRTHNIESKSAAQLPQSPGADVAPDEIDEPQALDDEDDEAEEGGTTVDYMLAVVRSDMDFFADWRI
ncbi:uncharacterized protein FIBRA_05092 [Fibroporia radiculosa]|uniref:DNA helicase n=1 Tax=Fibroporia radiculosa TaxID=599839 RepID=J4HWY0_9APHY|nr:uncharacterized protein FIBRA_05092 [Fibroporia radiculosa]CCM02977.1 predicted protein [Fibroporia radiculosa]